MGFNIYTEMFDQLSAALAGVIATYAGVIGWISGPLRVGVTIYIILLGFAILRGAVEYTFSEFVYRGMKLAALVFAVTTLYRSEEHTSELKSLMHISYAVSC